eukprot:TRINITY_DN1378_c0_g4_i1.p1 TRINITY_DN1378_c0_g4~~TRINITY_DN1378_c0_g4_i1.p1  ORF type:complete len:305 (+),score=62.12 TRINITY_DN1378_c0_g4_i1:127-1041(+)
MIRNSMKCKKCGSNDLRLLEANGSYMCFNCNTEQQGRFIDYTADWRVFSDTNTKNAVHASKTRGVNDTVDNTALDTTANEAYNKGISNTEKSRYKAKQLISDWCHRMGLPQKIEEKAVEFYCKLIDKEKLKGRNMRSIAAGLLAKACKANNQNILPKRIQEVTGVVVKDQVRATMFVNKKLKDVDEKMAPGAYVRGYCDELKQHRLKPICEEVCKTVIERSKINIEGRRPQTIAGAVLYLVCRAKRITDVTLGSIAEKVGCTENTITACYKIMIDPQSGLQDCFPKYPELTEFLKARSQGKKDD